MNYIVFDLEWNQCPQGKARENPRLPFEIVEIGAIKLNEDFEEIGRFHELIRPLVYHKLHRKTQEVIHLDEAELAHKRTFSPVIRDFFKWCGEDFEFVTWGSLDLSELQRNMDYYRIRNPLPMPLYYYDLQKMFSLLYDDGKSRSSLEDAVEFLKVPKDHAFHRAFDDTYYTAEIMKRMDMKSVCRYESVDYHRLPQDRAAEIEIDFGTYRKYVSREFPTKEDVLADKKVTSMRCVRCGLPVFKRVKWFSAGANMYLCLVQCPRHGYTKGKIRLKKASDGGHFAVKTIKSADAETVRSIREKQDAVKEKRKERRHRKSENKRTNSSLMLLLLVLTMSVMLPGRVLASAAETPAETQQAQQENAETRDVSETQAPPETTAVQETTAAPEVRISKAKLTIVKGKEKTLSLKNSDIPGKWKSSKKKVASVKLDKKTGKATVKAKKYGTAVITAKADGKEYTCEVTVVDPSLNRTSVTLLAGDTFQLKAKKYTGKTKWSVKNSKIASISGTGLITAKKKGKTKIIFRANKTDIICKLKVLTGSLASTSIRLAEGKTAAIKRKGKAVPDSYSSDDEKIAKVSDQGVITGVKSGETIIRAHYGESVRSCYVTVDKKSAYKTFGQTIAQRTSGIASVRDRYLGSDSRFRFLQGSCTDGKYAYFILGDQSYKDSCALIKVRLKDWSIVKHVKDLPLGHGNDLTYDSKRKQLVAVHASYRGKGNAQVVSLISPKKLKIKKTVSLDEDIYAAAYNAKKDRFAFGVSDTEQIVIKDKAFHTVKTFSLLRRGTYTHQGIDADNKYIYVLQSNLSQGKTRVLVYTWKGVYCTTIHLNGKREAESLFHVKNKFYIASNNAYYDGGQIYETALKHYYQVKYLPGDGDGTAVSKMVKTGQGFVTAECSFKNEGYKFRGYTAFRASDGKACYRHKNTKKVKWFESGEQPDGYKVYVIKEGKTLKSFSDVPGDCIIMTATWKKK